MTKMAVDVVICGAGIAGISAAYHLSVRHGIRNILLVDPLPPLSLTSDKSTECYRNWWPGPGVAMVAFMNRSIDLMETLAQESGNVFHLNRRGYLYLTADPIRLPDFIQAAREPEALGAGDLRIHAGKASDPGYIPNQPGGFEHLPDGADLLLDQVMIHKQFPYLADTVVAALHVRRAGWFSAQQLGAFMLESAREHGVKVIRGQVSGIIQSNGSISAIRLSDGSEVHAPYFVNAAGPYLRDVSRLMKVDLPVHCELHQKVSFRDTLASIPRDAPLLIWNDPQHLPWSEAERAFLREDEQLGWLLDEFPGGVHTRPEGGADSNIALMLWEYKQRKMPPVFPPVLDEQFPEIALRGLATMLPGLKSYFEKFPRPMIDGGYYTKTSENRPLIGPLPVSGSFVIGAMSGYGLMAACAAGELLAAHLTQRDVPAYAPAFSLERYSDPDYRQLLASWGNTGQL
jgi:glycine/D-amino acid oxidase-like deaminating enzyme